MTNPMITALIAPDTMPWLLGEVAVIGCAVAVSLVALTVWLPPLVRELRTWYRGRRVRAEFEVR